MNLRNPYYGLGMLRASTFFQLCEGVLESAKDIYQHLQSELLAAEHIGLASYRDVM